MKIKHTGQQANPRVIVDRQGREFRTDDDGNVEVPDALGTRLLEQSIWEEPKQTINTSTESTQP